MVTQIAANVLRNLLGWTVILTGLLASLPFMPGPGFVIVLIGLAIADWPGKRRWFRWLRTFRWFRRVDDWAHRAYGRYLPEHRTYRREQRLARVAKDAASQ